MKITTTMPGAKIVIDEQGVEMTIDPLTTNYEERLTVRIGPDCGVMTIGITADDATVFVTVRRYVLTAFARAVLQSEQDG